MRFFVYEGADPSRGAFYMGTSIMAGGAATSVLTSFRGLSKEYIRSTWTTFFEFFNNSRSGANCWNSLARMSADAVGKNLILVPIDWSNDSDVTHYQKSREAWIRRIWTHFPGANICVIIWPVVNADGTITLDNSVHTSFKALCDYYDIQYVDVHAEIYDRVMVDSDPITDFYDYPTDRVHPLDAGHQVGADLIEPLLPALLFGARQFTGTLPARYYEGSDEYEHAPSICIDGTDYDSKTGTWTESGGTISSNSAGATVTYLGDFCSIGWENSTGVYANVEYSIDGGEFATTNTGHHGLYIGAYGAHTVTFRVLTTMEIIKFVAV